MNIAGVDLYIRTSTPDLDVAVSGLVDKEYEHIRCPDPMHIVDAGANIGTSAIYFARKYPTARIVAVEPEAGNFELLVSNTREYENIVPVKAALWGHKDRRTIQNRNTGHWGYTVTPAEQGMHSTGQTTDCVTVEALMEAYGLQRIDLFKMDIEGGEKDVLENSSGWINSVGVLTVELHDRICPGCSEAFHQATTDYRSFEQHGEKVTAYNQ